MALLQHFGRQTGVRHASGLRRDCALHAPRLAWTHGHLGPGGASHRAAPPPSIARSTPVDAGVLASTSSAAPDSAAAADSAPAACCQQLPAGPSASAASPTAAEPAGPAAAQAEAAAVPAVQPEAPGDAAAASAASAEEATAEARTSSEAGTSSSGSSTAWPGRGRRNTTITNTNTNTNNRNYTSRGGGGGAGGGGAAASSRPAPPPYADALTGMYVGPRQRPARLRPAFLEAYPVPPGKIFNVNSFLGKRDAHGGQYLVPERHYRDFLASYSAALDDGYMLYLTENYHQRVYKFFLEFDWDWNTDLALVMEVTPQLVSLATSVASEFYRTPYANVITSIRTPYKIHLNFPQLLTTELLACLCRDRLLEECTAKLGPQYGSAVDWERLIDFPHGSLRLMGSRKAPHMDSDPAWVLEKAYHPARLTTTTSDGGSGGAGGAVVRWQPGRITPALLLASSIVPQRHQVAAFERSPAYLDLIFSDLEAYTKKMEERRQERARRRAEREQQQRDGSQPSPDPAVVIPNLPPGSSRNPLYVRLEVQPDDTVALKVHIKSKFRRKGMQAFVSSRPTAPSEASSETSSQPGAPPSADGAALEASSEPAAAEAGAEAAPSAAAGDGAEASADSAGARSFV
ncbi:Scaffold-type E3 ligase [Pleodorina starrii]|uniref:Scaffold-type E3 ligase n=1 Tax=Pleodorina starrii TaxID=330485 RepID=A0A9W6BRM5_9CHLO|nr:Scaffold-type E3 ligase [Pleodorina starrii]GLC57206.1 Scaffold-type E3 ligase [Pleodorina starrii]GLC71410.1 Scaffold-type E3 ligase [Pleodorina starrii]